MAFGFSVLQLPLYLLGYLVIQCGSNTALAAYSGIIPDMVPHDQRGTASGYMAVMSQASTLCGAIISGIMLGNHQNLQLYVLMAVVFGVFVVVAVLGLKEVPLKGPVERFDWGRYFRSLWIDPRKYPDYAWVWLTRALMMFGFYMIQPYILYFLRDVIQVAEPEKKASVVIGIILLSATISGFLGGLLSDRLGRKPVVIYSSVIIAATCLMFLFCRNLEQLLGAGVIFGLGYGAYISVDWALGTDVLPSRQDAGKDMAVWHISMTLPQQVAPLLAGQVLGLYVAGHIMVDGKSVGTYGWTGYAIVFCVAAACFFVSGILVKKVRGTS
jgi:MFS family permease